MTGSQSVCAGATAVYTQVGGVAGGVWSVVPAAAGTIDAGGNFASSGVFAGNATITYTDNSTGLGCAGSIVVVVNAITIPTFAAIAAICSGDVAPFTCNISNGISGSWSPALVSNTASGTYTFTPAAGACASTATVNVTVNPQTTPTFAAIAPICSGDVAPVLPAVSIEGIAGSWLPAVVSNTASGTYTFTPNAGACASTATINVTVNPQTTPTFAPIAAICSGDVAPVLPAVSIEGIAGSWLPALVSNTSSGAYTFTPNAGSCASTATVNVTVNPQTLPTFAAIAAICSGDVAPILPATSSNGITGTWLPAVVSNTASGTYTFTPAAGSCASTATVNVTVNASPQISVSDNCTGATADVTVTIVSGNPTNIFFDGAVGTSQRSFVGVANGNHTIVATDANGCSDSEAFATNCIPGCPTITVTGSQSVCAGA
ncbi:MAG: gliding motility-associated C-terminal domain-containing protein, partial [Sphingobacteriales bacterium]|nr:gliding motility-associated C-terminal domain-containing protein [Sphingobacteriales bacterium]